MRAVHGELARPQLLSDVVEQPDAVFDFDGEDVERPGLGFDDPRGGVAEAVEGRGRRSLLEGPREATDVGAGGVERRQAES